MDHETPLPISSPKSDCAECALMRGGEPVLTRLAFLKQAAGAIAPVAALGALSSLAACAGGFPTAPSTLTATTITLASNPALANVGGVVTLRIDDSPIAVVRESATTFAAFSLICPHQGNTVQPQTTRFFCPGHRATFDLSGQWTGGQRTSNLRSYTTTYDATAGTVTVGG